MQSVNAANAPERGELKKKGFSVFSVFCRETMTERASRLSWLPLSARQKTTMKRSPQ